MILDLNFSAKTFEKIVLIMQKHCEYIDHQKVAEKLIKLGIDEDQADWIINIVAFEDEDIIDIEQFLLDKIEDHHDQYQIEFGPYNTEDEY